MKILFALLSFFAISSLSASQEFPQWGLPDGVRARLGKGAASQMQFSPDGARLAVALISGPGFTTLQPIDRMH